MKTIDFLDRLSVGVYVKYGENAIRVLGRWLFIFFSLSFLDIIICYIYDLEIFQ